MNATTSVVSTCADLVFKDRICSSFRVRNTAVWAVVSAAALAAVWAVVSAAALAAVWAVVSAAALAAVWAAVSAAALAAV